jgi:SAM-dependent methyltransferase
MIKHYQPIKEIIDDLLSKTKDYVKILEIGPGQIPFPGATHFIDHIMVGPNIINIDICNDKFPWEDNFFDFVYCRHVLEDIQNPVACFKEIVRVGKRGYIETPSAIVEISRHVDRANQAFRGYIHHRYIFWNEANVLNCIAKYPCIEYLKLPDCTSLLQDKYNWNNYYLWDKDTAKIKEWKNDIDFKINQHYEQILQQIVPISLQVCQAYKNNIN